VKLRRHTPEHMRAELLFEQVANRGGSLGGAPSL
jgi:hypothetical protein